MHRASGRDRHGRRSGCSPISTCSAFAPVVATTCAARSPRLRADVARADLLEMITSMPWENLCAEVLKLRIELPELADIIPIRRP